MIVGEIAYNDEKLLQAPIPETAGPDSKCNEKKVVSKGEVKSVE